MLNTSLLPIPSSSDLNRYPAWVIDPHNNYAFPASRTKQSQNLFDIEYLMQYAIIQVDFNGGSLPLSCHRIAGILRRHLSSEVPRFGRYYFFEQFRALLVAVLKFMVLLLFMTCVATSLFKGQCGQDLCTQVSHAQGCLQVMLTFDTRICASFFFWSSNMCLSMIVAFEYAPVYDTYI